MKIAVKSDWSFEDVLAAAWREYPGRGPQHGATNRIRLLEQWANVVGRERACRELEAAIESGADLGLTDYAIGKIRREFRAMPQARARRQGDLYSFLRSLPRQEFPNEVTMMAKVLPRFVELLGYPQEHLFFSPSLAGDPRLRPDAIVGATRIETPALLIELKILSGRPARARADALDQLRRYLQASGAGSAVLLTPDQLWILSDVNGSPDEHDLANITKEQARAIGAQLARSDDSKSAHSDLPRPDRTRLEDLLDAVSQASSNDEKKKSLEGLAGALLRGLSFVRVKYTDLVTKSSEIDLVCEYMGHTGPTIFDEHGRYFLVECKNWRRPIDAKGVRDFQVKIQSTRSSLGLIFSRSGVTGTKAGTDGVGFPS